ncbi:MAG: hypothetical protein E7036_06755 [Opitutales bacterium]|nr:hypothetical protein [Opitutales bacterium]
MCVILLKQSLTPSTQIYASWVKIGMACFHSNPDSLQLWVKW